MSLASDADLVKQMATYAANSGNGFADYTLEQQIAYDDACERIGEENISLLGYREEDGLKIAILGPYVPDEE